MKKRQSKFNVGDTVFYPSAGVGLIEGVEDVFIGGRCDPCFVIGIAETRMTIKIPQANVQKSGLRPLLSSRKLKELFRILSAEGNHRVPESRNPGCNAERTRYNPRWVSRLTSAARGN